MTNEAFEKRLNKALQVFHNFKVYCSKFGIKVGKIQVCIKGVKKLIPLTKENFSSISWFSHNKTHKVLIKFSSDKPLITKINGIGFNFGAYELPLDKFKLNTLKESINDQDKQVMLFRSTIKKWALKNKVNFLKYSENASEYDCCVYVSDTSQDSCSTGVAIRKEPLKFVTSKWDNESEEIKDEFDSMKSLLEYLDRWLNSDETKQVKSRIKTMKTFIHKTSGKTVTAYCKEDALKVFAFNADNISDSTKALYETMNEGSFKYNYRTNDDFKGFIKDTLLEEVVDNIRSSRELIKKCVEKRVQSYSIVWDALYMIFNYVKKANGLTAKIDSTKMKNWFAFNNVDYKTALMPIVEYVDKELRPELRESEKTV